MWPNAESGDLRRHPERSKIAQFGIVEARSVPVSRVTDPPELIRGFFAFLREMRAETRVILEKPMPQIRVAMCLWFCRLARFERHCVCHGCQAPASATETPSGGGSRAGAGSVRIAHFVAGVSAVAAASSTERHRAHQRALAKASCDTSDPAPKRTRAYVCRAEAIARRHCHGAA